MYHIKKDKRSQQSRERIYRALVTCMMSMDFNNITIKKLIEEAEVARATFYRNFDRIEDVLEFETDRRFDELYKHLKAYYRSEPEFYKSFFLVPYLKFWHDDSEIIVLLIKAGKLNMLKNAFISLLKRGIHDYHGDEEIEIDNFSYFLALRSGIAINVLVEWVGTNKKETPDEVIDIIFGQMDSSMNREMFRK